jgi:hypothetical protein
LRPLFRLCGAKLRLRLSARRGSQGGTAKILCWLAATGCGQDFAALGVPSQLKSVNALAHRQHTSSLARRDAREFGCRDGCLRHLRRSLRVRTERWQLHRTRVRNYRLCLHGICRLVGRAKKSASVEAWPRANVDARALVAWPAEPSADLLSRWIQIRRIADDRAHDSADRGCRERHLWRRFYSTICPPSSRNE